MEDAFETYRRNFKGPEELGEEFNETDIGKKVARLKSLAVMKE